MLDISNFMSLCVALVTLYVLANLTKMFSKKRYPPGPWGFPVVGHLPLFGDIPEKTFLRWWREYGDVVRIRLGSWDAIIVNGFETVKDVTEKDDIFSGRPNFVTQIGLREAFDGTEILGFANFTPKYLQLRKLMTTALRNYISRCDYSPENLFREETEKLTEKLLKYSNDEPVSIVSDVEFTMESIIYQMCYGKGKESEIEEHVKEIVEALAIVNEFTASTNIVDVIPWMRYIMKQKLRQFIKAAKATDWITHAKTEEHRISFQEDQTRDVLDALFAVSKNLPQHENADSISKVNLLTQIVQVQAGGFDPISRLMLFIILYLAAFPDVQERVQQEIDEVIGTSVPVSWKDRNKLPYVNATIHEIMRITCIVPFAVPHFTMQDTSVCGYDVDKGTVVMINLHSVANEKSFWGDPINFRPERLLKQDGQLDAEKCSHILLFSAGRRRCAGELIARMNIFIVTTTLMQRCSFKKADGCDLDLEPIRRLLHSPKPFKVIVQNRQ